MRADLIRDHAQLAEIESEWRSLAELRGCAFVTPEWFSAWWEHRPNSASTLVAAVRRPDGSLAGVMPLVLERSRRPHVIRFAGARFGDRFVPAASQADEADVVAAVMRALGDDAVGRHALVLDHIDHQGAWRRAIEGTVRPGRAMTEQQQTELAYIRLSDYQEWDGYLADRSRNFRQQIRRRERALRRDHDVKVRLPTDATLSADLARLFDLHMRRWRDRGGSSLDSPAARAFIGSFAGAAHRRGWLRLRTLEVDGTAVAAFLGWRVGDSYAFYQSGFDPDWSRKSVGQVLMAMTVRSALEEGASEFDMLLGEEPYKKRFTNAGRLVSTAVLTKPLSPTRLLIAAEAIARRYGRGLAERPAFSGVARSLRRVLPTSRGS